MNEVEKRLSDLGIVLPTAAAPVASYVPTVEAGNMLFISGQLPFIDGKLETGKCGDDRDLSDGQAAARACGLMLAAQMKAALGDLSRVKRIVKLGVFVASSAEFTDQPKVANGASDLMVEIFGDAGKHARSAVSVPVLPLNALVEIDAIISFE